ncbi:Uncharacterised protein [Myroides odoratus]|uniref:Uncharacterized protein n=1 Tax=Myroides odoratus TaxID=256 RepID=A0A378RRT2_MYROD|nr:Uncharacterised protein [Myroides odoratus]
MVCKKYLKYMHNVFVFLNDNTCLSAKIYGISYFC